MRGYAILTADQAEADNEAGERSQKNPGKHLTKGFVLMKSDAFACGSLCRHRGTWRMKVESNYETVYNTDEFE